VSSTLVTLNKKSRRKNTRIRTVFTAWCHVSV